MLRTVIELEPNIANKIVLATIYLHNFIRRHESSLLYDRDVRREANAERSQNSHVLSEFRGITTSTSEQLM